MSSKDDRLPAMPVHLARLSPFQKIPTPDTSRSAYLFKHEVSFGLVVPFGDFIDALGSFNANLIERTDRDVKATCGSRLDVVVPTQWEDLAHGL